MTLRSRSHGRWGQMLGVFFFPWFMSSPVNKRVGSFTSSQSKQMSCYCLGGFSYYCDPCIQTYLTYFNPVHFLYVLWTLTLSCLWPMRASSSLVPSALMPAQQPELLHFLVWENRVHFLTQTCNGPFLQGFPMAFSGKTPVWPQSEPWQCDRHHRGCGVQVFAVDRARTHVLLIED